MTQGQGDQGNLFVQKFPDDPEGPTGVVSLVVFN